MNLKQTLVLYNKKKMYIFIYKVICLLLLKHCTKGQIYFFTTYSSPVFSL